MKIKSQHYNNYLRMLFIHDDRVESVVEVVVDQAPNVQARLRLGDRCGMGDHQQMLCKSTKRLLLTEFTMTV